MIKRSLRKLRQQPKSTRDHIAFVVAGSLTGIVALVWLYHTPTMFGKGTAGVVSGGNQSEQPGFTNLFSDFGSQMASVKESFTEVQETMVEEEPNALLEAEEPQFEEVVSEEDDVTQEEGMRATTSNATQPRTIRIITTTEDTGDVNTSEGQ